MVARREMVGGGLLAGVAALFLPDEARAGAGQSRGDAGAGDVARAIDELRQAFVAAQECRSGRCSGVEAIRLQQQNFLKANQKFPDYIDAGIEVWQDVYDWHVRNRQPVNTTRLPDGRYGIAFMFTTVILRPDNQPSYLSFGYDAR
jgi:hypothetical protein